MQNMRRSRMEERNFEGKTVLVSGAAGFIPSHLSEFYLKLGAKVIGLDNFQTGQQSNIDLLKKYDNFHFYECNTFEQIPDLSQYKIDFIFNMASPASPVDFELIPIEIMRVNSEGTMNMLNLAVQHGARFLEASTSEVYGDPEVHPQRECYTGSVNVIGPRACYDESKRYAEAMTMSFHRKYNLETRIVRIFNTYGPRMRHDDGRVVPNFIGKALRGEPLKVYGDGSQTRSFCYVDDLVRGIHAVMMSSEVTPVNVGNPEERTILDAAKNIIKILESKSEIGYLPLPVDDPRKRRPDISKLQGLSDFKPQVSFEEGMRKTAEYFKQHL